MFLGRTLGRSFLVSLWLVVPLPAQTVECATRVDDALGDCGIDICDSPAERDAWAADQTTAAKLKLRMKVHIFDPAIMDLTPESVRIARIETAIQRAVDDMNARNIRFPSPVPYQTYSGSAYGVLADEDEMEAMIFNHGDGVYVQLNVFVADTSSPYLNFNGRGEFPWDDSGGVIVLDGGVFDANYSVFTHEIGHVLGLWHTYHGTSRGELEVHGGGCGDIQWGPCYCECYEPVGLYGDYTGDLCSDTQATTQSNYCSNPNSPHPCEEEWGTTDYRNFMSGSQGSCRNHFTAQQTRRMHCWTCDEHAGWIDDVEGACCIDDECSIQYKSCCLNRGGYFAGPDTVCGNDCDENQVADVCEFDTGGCCNGSTCSVMAESCCDDINGSFGGHLSNCLDCNENEAADACDIASSASDDCNENGRPDECEIADNPLADCNENDTLDECEIIAHRACCLPDETCQDLTQCACNALDGTWVMLNKLCHELVCAIPPPPQP